MIKTVTENIDGNEYVITTFDAIKGNLILFKLIKYLRGGASLLDGLLDSESVMDEDVAIGSVLERIITTIDPEELNTFLIDMFQSTALNNSPMTHDVIKHHFAGNYLEMYKVLIAIIKANYVNDGTKAFFAQAQEKITKVVAK